MPRGGKRPGSGSKPKWKHGKTKVIRVPEALADRILEIAKDLDNGVSFISSYDLNKIVTFDSDTLSKTVNLTGVSLISIAGQMGVRLNDLVERGYILKPQHLNDIVRKMSENKGR